MPEAELYQVFNMGIGMVLIVDGEQADRVLRWLRSDSQKAWIIGDVVKGRGAVRVLG